MKTDWLLQKVRKPHLYATFFHPVIQSYVDTPQETMFMAKQQEIKHQWFLRILEL